jgi:hypothetical protein
MTKHLLCAATILFLFHDARADDGVRPDSIAIGIGAGYTLGLPTNPPQTLPMPNTFGVRVRLPGGIELEPRVAVVGGTTTVENLQSDGTVVTTPTSFSDKSFELRAFVPVVRRGRFDLKLVATGRYDRFELGGVATTGLGLGYGLAISWWATRHVELSLEATNPIYSSVHQPDGMELSTFGLVFAPTVTAMAHVFVW